MRWYEAILAVAVAMWIHERLRDRRKSGAPPEATPDESEESFARDTLPAHEQAAIEYPDNADVHIGLARALHELGRNDEALKALERAAELDPGSYADFWSGMVNLQVGRNGEALEFFDRATGHHPDDAIVHYSRGRALAGLAGEQDPREARASYEMAAGAFGQALRLDPHHAGASEALDGVRRRLAPAGGGRLAAPPRKG